jgi:carbonic anhydrase
MAELPNEEKKLAFLVKQNVREQVHNVWLNSYVQQALHNGTRIPKFVMDSGMGARMGLSC